MSETGQKSGGLSAAFKKANHVRHNIMDASMLLMAVGAAVLAAGPMVAVFDPITPFIKMHFEGFVMAFETLPDFISHAVENAGHGVWSSGVEVGSAHAGHSAAVAAAGHGVHGGSALFDQWLGALSPEEISGIQSDLQGPLGGMSMREYFELNFSHGMHVK